MKERKGMDDLKVGERIELGGCVFERWTKDGAVHVVPEGDERWSRYAYSTLEEALRAHGVER